MNNKTSLATYAAVTIAAVILLIVVYYIGRSYGKALPPNEVDVPDDLTSSSDEKIKQITDELFKDIDGIAWGYYHNISPYQEFNILSDNDVVRVINYWNQKYYSKHKERLSEAISNEEYYFGDSKIAGITLSRLKKFE